jgi:dolichol-phosphate mannosyltransferase
MTTLNETLTVIVPVYNEADCLEFLTTELQKFLNASPIDTFILFVDDGSTDKSRKIIEKICNLDSRFEFIFLKKNSGLSTALKAGFDKAHTSLIGYIDADAQTSPMDFLKLLEYIPEYDLVTGIRQKRQDTLVKRLTSLIANKVRRWLISDGIRDSGCPLKIIKKVYAQNIQFFKGMHRFIPALVLINGGKVMQIPIQHFPRYAGKSKYNTWNRLNGPLADMLVLRWMKKRMIKYSIRKKHVMHSEGY